VKQTLYEALKNWKQKSNVTSWKKKDIFLWYSSCCWYFCSCIYV